MRIACAFALAFLASAARADIALIQRERPLATVIIPQDPSEGHRFAAQELVDHLRLSTGVELPVVEEGQAVKGVPIFVGDTKAAKERPSLAELPADSFEVFIRADRIVLRGRNPLADLYAVYDFLEREVGVRWLTPAENGTVVPRHETLTVRETSRTESPAFRLRMFFVRNDETALWALRNRINGLFPAAWAEKVDGDLAFLPPGVGSGIHSFADLIPPKGYFEAHPEYFPLIGGKRQPISIGGGQLCTTNPDVIRIIADKVDRYFDEHPQARIFSVAPDDDARWCECDNCRKVDEELGAGRRWSENESLPVTTDRLLLFLNQVAERALAEHPDKTIITLSYINYLPPPVSVRVDPYVMPLICHYAPACYAHQMSDPACAANARFVECLRGWVPQCPNAGVYAYTDKSMWYWFWRPVFRLMPHDIRFLHETGIRNYLAQSGADNWEYMGPLYWVTAKMLWDPSCDIDALIEEWCRTLYGPAGEAMLTHYNELEQAVLATGRHYSDDPNSQAVGLYDMDHIDRAMAALSQAGKLARAQEATNARVQAVMERQMVSRACYGYLAAYRRYEETGDLTHLKMAISDAGALAQRVGEDWAPYSCPTLTDLERELTSGGIRWSGFGKEEEKGGKACRNTDETGLGDGAAGWATVQFLVPDETKATRLKMVVWGQSSPVSPSICSKGRGAGRTSGGEWSGIGTFTPSGPEEWQEAVFEIPATRYEAGVRRQIVGFGGGDSQIWVADIRVEADR